MGTARLLVGIHVFQFHSLQSCVHVLIFQLKIFYCEWNWNLTTLGSTYATLPWSLIIYPWIALHVQHIDKCSKFVSLDHDDFYQCMLHSNYFCDYPVFFIWDHVKWALYWSGMNRKEVSPIACIVDFGYYILSKSLIVWHRTETSLGAKKNKGQFFFTVNGLKES
jgi:hypothetical protein